MASAGPEIEDARSRLLVRLERAPSAVLEEALKALQAADRLGGLLAEAPVAASLAPLALALPTALLVVGAAPSPGAAGTCVAAGDTPETTVERARTLWGEDAILIADVGVSRHAAMEAGEFGADVILFRGETPAVVDCIAWWSELFVLPAAAWTSPDALDALVMAGADFILIEDAWVAAEESAPSALVERLRAAERRRGSVRTAARETEDDEDQR